MSTIAQKILFFRDLRGLSQTELSEKSGVPQSSISKIETGQLKNPGGITLQKLAAALGVSVAEMLNDSDPAATDQTA
ncbi:MAG: helix-turn-helix domain-containing protein [Negativicutes bacterium]|nr:helix-turn-helix domain-containing protein [Negativicutes bacterium]